MIKDTVTTITVLIIILATAVCNSNGITRPEGGEEAVEGAETTPGSDSVKAGDEFTSSPEQGKAPVLSFRDAVTEALRNNPLIAVARNNAEMAENNAHIGNAGLLPRVNLSGSSDYTGTDRSSSPGSSGLSGSGDDLSTTAAHISASYTLFDGLANISRYRRLSSQGRQSELEARDQIEGILISVSNAYYRAASAMENLRIARRLLEISRERLERAEQRADFGQGGMVDVLAARVDFNSDTVTVVNARFDWEEAKRNLNVLLDRNISTHFNVEREITFASLDSMETMRRRAYQQNAYYLSTVESVEQARLNRTIARSAYLPRLDLSTSYGYSHTADGYELSMDDPTRSWNARATLSFNLFDGFQRKTDNTNAAIQVRNSKLLRRQARRELERNLSNAYQSYLNSRTVLDLERSNLEAARVNFRRTRELYDLGQATSTRFREAQLNLIQAETNLSTARYNAKLDEIELMRITGSLVRETGDK